jgi:tRNA nucleotidyltransferase (CCA-adding enzyme)
VWQEFAKGLMEDRPSRMFEVLRSCGALARLLPELDALFGVPQRADYHPEIDAGVHVMMVVDLSARLRFALPVRWAALLHDLGKGSTPADILPRHIGHEERGYRLAEAVCARLRVPADCRDLALLTTRHHGNIHRGERSGANALRPDTMVGLLEKADAFRRPERFELLLQACECDYRGRLGWEGRVYHAGEVWRQALAAARAVDAGAIALSTADKAKIPQRINAARVEAVTGVVAGMAATPA